MTTHRHDWLHVTMHRHDWCHVTIHRHDWCHVTIHRHDWLHVAMHRHDWLHVAMQRRIHSWAGVGYPRSGWQPPASTSIALLLKARTHPRAVMPQVPSYPTLIPYPQYTPNSICCRMLFSCRTLSTLQTLFVAECCFHDRGVQDCMCYSCHMLCVFRRL